MLQPVQIRLAKVSDSAGLAKVQVSSYQTAYRGFLPDAFLDQFSLEEQTQDWLDLLAQPDHDPLYVVVDSDDQVLGYALGRRLMSEPFDCELRSLHVLKEYQRQGYGRALIAAIARHYADAGCKSLILWTMKGNTARVMYEKLGGELIDEKTDVWDDGTQVIEVAYGWQDIQALIQATRCDFPFLLQFCKILH
jgi:GNAT superfamily N-acetyltransferase